MIHVLNFEGNIIDFISNNDNAIIHAKHNRDINERTETYNLTMLSDRATHFLNKNRVIIQDSNKRYREFIIDHIESSEDGYTEIEMSASYLTDIATAKPLAPNKLDKMTTSQALDDVLKDTGWQRSDETEYGGVRTTSWTSYQTKYEVLLQLCTTYDMSLDFYIELGSNKVKNRYVSLKEKNPLFKGKEIVKGKDLLNLKRTVDLNEVRTALLCVGPEKDDGTHLELVVTDDEAQEQFGLPQRYLWGIYEPESEDSSMTEARLRTLGTTELNKRKIATISYEVSATDIKKESPHEIVNLGDLVRIKDRDFNPPLYIEAEVIGEEYDPISEDSTYTFGQFKEYNESDLRAEFNKKLSSIQKKLVDSINNVNTIIRDTLDDELQYYEQKIIKSDTPPENPVNDMLWYDTSNPNVAVLWRYFNGEWREHSVNDVEQIGGVTREKALFSELNNTFINLSIQHAKLLNEVYEVMNSEYLVNTDLKTNVNKKLNDTIGVYNQIKTNLDSMTPETATIGKLIDTQTLYLTYRERIQSLYTVLETAKIAIDDRIKLLQSQYTDEKFNEAMQGVATAIGGTYNEETGQLIANIPNNDMLEELRTTIEQSLSDLTQANQVKLQELQDGITETNQRITSTNDELSAGITSVTQKVDGLKVGGRNLLQSFNESESGKIHFDLASTKAFIFTGWATELYNVDYFRNILKEGTTYTLTFEMEIKELATSEGVNSQNHGLVLLAVGQDGTKSINMQKQMERVVGNKIQMSQTFTINTLYDFRLVGYTGRYTPDGSLYAPPVTFNKVEVTNLKLEKGNIATAWTPAPEDISNQITKAQQEAEKAAKAYSDAQDNLKLIETKAYADGVVDDEERRAIQDAQTKLTEAKTYAEQKATDAKNAAISESERLSIEVTNAAKAYADAQDEVRRLQVVAYADGIVDDAEQKAIQDATDKMELAKTYAEQKAQEAKTYADDKIGNIKIGGRNLLPKFNFTFNATYQNLIKTTELLPVTNQEIWKVTSVNDTSHPPIVLGENRNVLLRPNQSIVGSVYVKIPQENEPPNESYLRLHNYGETITEASTTINANVNGEWQRITVTFTNKENYDKKLALLFYPVRKKNNVTHFSSPKMEYGNTATDWTPAPEDTEASIKKAQQDATNAAQAYADAQDNLKAIETKAYADGVVDEEEKRAIADAQAKLTEAKTYAEEKAAEAKTHADNAVSTISTTVTTQAADIKILKDGIALKADNTEVTKIYDQYLTPLQTQVNAQKATLDVLPSQIAAKVSQAKYDTDMNSVVGRLNTSDTERIQLANQISDRVTLNEYKTTKEKIENLSIGGRNLLRDSKNINFTPNTTGTGNASQNADKSWTVTADIGKAIRIHTFIKHTNVVMNRITQPFELGKEYISSIEVVTDKDTEIEIYSSSLSTSNYKYQLKKGIKQTIKLPFVYTTEIDNINIILILKEINAVLIYDNFKLEEGNVATAWTPAIEDITQDVDTKLKQRDTMIEQNGKDILLKASQKEFDANKKTLSRVLADLTINTTDGLTLSYNENGAITSHVVGPNGIKLKGDKVDIQANSEFNVLVGNVNNKVGKNEIINRLNVSPEGLDINVNNVGIRGGDATNYISIRNNEMLSYGVFERSWAGEKDTAKLALGIKDGRIMVRNQTTGYRLYLTERGLSTMMDGFSDDTSGTLEFHSQRFNETSRGITMHSTYGAVALLSEQSRIYTRSNLTNNIESFSYGVYIRPYMNTRAGLNEFNFYVKDADSASGTDGALLFGEISDSAGLAGSGIRFKKNAARGYDDMQSVVYATDNTGAINTGDFHARNLLGNWKSKGGYLYAMTPERTRFTNMDGYNNGNVTYTDIQCRHILSNTIRTNTGNDFYIGVSSAELRVTNNLFWNGGDTGYKPIRASDYLPGSLERFKRDIELWQGDALSEIRDNMTTYSYYLKDDDDERKKRKGLIIGDDYKTPDDFIDGDGVSLYNMITYSLRAIQQLDEQNQKLENKIKTLEEKYNE